VQQTPEVPAGHVAKCARCEHVVCRAATATPNRICSAITMAALILYPLGIALPVMSIRQLGHTHEASIWTGSISLLTHGQVFIGLVVFLCSVVIPLLKLGGMMLLTTRQTLITSPHRKAQLHRLIEIAGRWGMIDVLLIALLVAAMKLGDLVEVSPGPGVFAFGTTVLLSLVATAFFNPHAIWESP
jgi:paraquat-inducible protein A